MLAFLTQVEQLVVGGATRLYFVRVQTTIYCAEATADFDAVMNTTQYKKVGNAAI